MVTKAKRVMNDDREARHEKFCQYLAACIQAVDKTQFQISKELGYPNANFISLIKSGKSILPAAKVGDFARSLGLDPAQFLRIYMEAYQPEFWEVIKGIMKKEPVTAEEESILNVFRDVTGGHPAGPSTEEEKRELGNLAVKFQKRWLKDMGLHVTTKESKMTK